MASNRDDKKDKAMRALSYMLIPFVLAVPPVVGWFLGSLLDTMFDTKPYLSIAFVLLGFVSAIREVVRIIRKYGE